MDYCSTVWSPYTICNINKVEAIQRCAARFVLNDNSRYSSVTAMLSRLSWHTLKTRRSSLKLIMFFKIINQLVDIPVTNLKESCRCSRKQSHCYQQKQTRIEAYAIPFPIKYQTKQASLWQELSKFMAFLIQFLYE